MKFLLIFLSFLFAGALQAQEKNSNIDYQYIRTDDEYHAYSVLAKQEGEIKMLTIELVTSFNVSKLANIIIKKVNNNVVVPFTAINTIIINDNKGLNGLTIVPNLEKIWKQKIDCETVIVFLFENSKKIELPFMFCNLKAQVGN